MTDYETMFPGQAMPTVSGSGAAIEAPHPDGKGLAVFDGSGAFVGRRPFPPPAWPMRPLMSRDGVIYTPIRTHYEPATAPAERRSSPSSTISQ